MARGVEFSWVVRSWVLGESGHTGPRAKLWLVFRDPYGSSLVKLWVGVLELGLGYNPMGLVGS